MFKTSSRTRQNEQLTRCRLGSILCRLYLRLCRQHSVLHGCEATCPFVSVATCPFLLQLASVSVVLVLSLSWQRFIASRIFFKHSNENARPFLSFKCITLHFEFKKRHRLPERVYIQRILVRKTVCFSHFCIKTIILPRQARGKHRQDSKKECRFLP